MQTRPDVGSNQQLLEAQDKLVTQARSGYLPRLDLAFERNAVGRLLNRQVVNGVDVLNFTQPGIGGQLGNQVEYTIGLNLSWNLFDRFVTRLGVARAQNARDNAEIAVTDAKLQVQADIRAASVNYGSALKQVDAAENGMRSAERSFEAVAASYKLGSSSIVDVLTAQAALAQARTNQAQALTNLKLQRTSLEYATGKLAVPGEG